MNNNLDEGIACLELDSLFSFLFFVTQVNHATIDRKLKIQESHPLTRDSAAASGLGSVLLFLSRSIK
ncbi:hypothetical protein CUMW_072170 [Citrus unshiu]|nr:hypothetical protein CUMW_072170 [Citrus unshiu]